LFLISGFKEQTDAYVASQIGVFYQKN